MKVAEASCCNVGFCVLSASAINLESLTRSEQPQKAGVQNILCGGLSS